MPLVQEGVAFSSPETTAGPFLVETVAAFDPGVAEEFLRVPADGVDNCSNRGDPGLCPAAAPAIA